MAFSCRSVSDPLNVFQYRTIIVRSDLHELFIKIEGAGIFLELLYCVRAGANVKKNLTFEKKSGQINSELNSIYKFQHKEVEF